MLCTVLVALFFATKQAKTSGTAVLIDVAGAGAPKRTVLIREDFEGDVFSVKVSPSQLIESGAHSGRRCARAGSARLEPAQFVEVSFDMMAGHALEFSFWAKSEGGAGCTVGHRDRQSTQPVHMVEHLTPDWTQIQMSFLSPLSGRMSFRIVAKVPDGETTGAVFVDDIVLAQLESAPFTRPDVEDYPALSADRAGNVWAVVLGQPFPEREVRVYRAGTTESDPAFVLSPEGARAVVGPTVAGLDNGCFVAAAVERDERWQIAYAFVDGDSGQGVTGTVASEGMANIQPAAAYANGRVCLVWEANPAGRRGIYASWVTPEAATPPERVSSPDAASVNPAVIALANGDVFAAWDSARANDQDLYGAWCRAGAWSPERRLTRDPRMEHHVALAAHEERIWMAWQATSFPQHHVQSYSEQRVVVAALTGESLEVPSGFFDAVWASERYLRSPRIGFDPEGRLWLTARRVLVKQHGWQPVAWCYAGGSAWSGPHTLWVDEGRWRTADLAWGKQGGVAAAQRDTCNDTLLTGGPRKSEVMLIQLAEDWAGDPRPLETVPLEMPKTEFRLAQRIEHGAASFPRATMTHRGQTLTLYWGDLHEHTDVSVCWRVSSPTAHDLYTTQRDVEGLDFTAITDHGEHMDEFDWIYLHAEATGNHDPGRFVTFLAQEWTSGTVDYDPPRSYKRYGHHNLVFLDPHFARYFNAHQTGMSPRALWDELAGADFVTIPHQLADHGSGANMPTDWSFTDERLQPLAEICQQRGSYEYDGCPRQAEHSTAKGHFLQDAWEQEIVIGVIASADHGGGYGKAGIWAKELTRDSLFEAFRARHTFGMSDPKMSLFVTSGDAMMGDVVARTSDDPIPFHVRAATPRPIREVVIWRNNEIVHRSEPNATELDLEWVDEQPLDVERAWYYVRLHCTDDELAWSSPIWFDKN